MSLHTSAWGRPIQGISQQPPKVRIEGQATEQINAVSSAVSGLYKRPGTSLIGDLDNALPEDTLYYYYNRGSGEEYFIVIPPGELPRVYDKEGDSLVVETPEGFMSYVISSNPRETLRLTTISDFTFIANKEVVPLESSEDTGELDRTAIISSQFGDYGRKYIVRVNGVDVATYLTPDGSDSGHLTWVDTTTIAEILYKGSSFINESTPPGSAIIEGDGLQNLEGYSVSWDANSIFLVKDDGSEFSVTTIDGADGLDLVSIQNSVPSVDRLPSRAPDGYKVEVVGTGSTNTDKYWLQADRIEGSTVRWSETVAPSISKGVNPTTMPHTLIRDRFESGKAVFVLKTGEWDEREVGDDRTNPQPSFIQEGMPITSVGTFQNRLFVTAGESVVYSQSNFFFNFYKTTAREELDDGPIDVYADTNQVNILQNSAVLDGDVVFFSKNGQFLQAGDQPVTPGNATLQYASTFESNIRAQPVAAGDVIFFAFEYGRFSGIREFYTDSFTDTKRARPVTDHVDEYIRGPVRQMASSTNRNQLFVLAEDKRKVYVYRWIWEGQERVQSSWSVWEFSGDVRFISYDRETVYFIVDRDGVMRLETLETGDPNDVGLSFPVRLDSRFRTSAVKQNGVWEIISEYPSDDILFVRGEGCQDPGLSIESERVGNRRYVTQEDLAEEGVTEVEVVGGIPYKMVYQPTMPFIRDNSGKVIDTDKLIINDVNINYDKTGSIRIIVRNRWGNERVYEFNGRRIGDVSNIVGFAPLSPGQFSFPVRQDSDQTVFWIESEGHLPFQLRDMEWRGRFRQRGRRV